MSGSPFGVLEYLGAKKAGEAAAESAQKGIDAEWRMYNQTREDLAPWRVPGGQAMNALWSMVQQGPGEFKESPSYQFTLGEGLKGIQKQASGLGRLQSGEYLKGITGYAENMASKEYDNFLNRYYQSLNPYSVTAGMGQVSAGQQAAANTATGNTLTNAYGQLGQTQAARLMGQYNALSRSMGQIGSGVGNYFSGMGGVQAAQGWGGWGNTIAGSGAGANAMMWL